MSDKITRDAQILDSKFGKSTTKSAVYTDLQGNQLIGVAVTQEGQSPTLRATLECKNGRIITGKEAKTINAQLKGMFQTTVLGFTLADAPQEGTSTVDIPGKNPMVTACTAPPKTR